ncbi:MAG TPA: hypothetical protein VKP08_03500, partial [Anaerolineales bacterium]|nr:hypothetical protein [Anaerolineales bacterium]
FWWTFARYLRFVSAGAPISATWFNAILAGLLGGFAIFIKFSAAFFVIGGALGLALSSFTLRDLLRKVQVWVLALIGALPAAAYLIYGIFIRGDLASQFNGRFVPALLLNPFNYLQWEVKADMAAGGIFIMLGLLGLLLVKDRRLQVFLYGAWSAYILYGLFFDYHIATHDYYHLPFIPIVGLSLAPLGEWFFVHLTDAAPQGAVTARRWMRIAAYAVLVYGLFAVLWNVRNQMKAVDYRPEAAMWAEISEQFSSGASAIALTQDYGSRLEYWGGRRFQTWPYLGDAGYANLRGADASFDAFFDKHASKKDYFLVTDLDEFDRQSQLKERLFSSYPVYREGNGYLIFDLKPEDSNGS